MDFFINTEYIDRERRIDLISLGIVDADGREFYAISSEFDAAQANAFVRTVVLPQLEPDGHPAWMTRTEMRSALLDYIGDEQPTFWSWSAAPWDWMAMAQLLGLAERVPNRWDYTCYDLSLLAEAAGYRLNPVDDRLPQAPNAVHHALADARWFRRLHAALTRVSETSHTMPTHDSAGRPIRDFVIDTEFIEGDQEIDLVSLAVVADDGSSFYAVSDEFDPLQANDFVRSRVLPQLEPADDPARMSRAAIRDRLVGFVGDAAPRFWTWGGLPYDWLVMAQLFAVQDRVPDGWRYTGYDLTQRASRAGYRTNPPDDRFPAAPDNAHHALADARWGRAVLNVLDGRTVDDDLEAARLPRVDR